MVILLSDGNQVGLLHAHTGAAGAGLPPLLQLLLLGLVPDWQPMSPSKLPKAGAALVQVPSVTQVGKLVINVLTVLLDCHLPASGLLALGACCRSVAVEQGVVAGSPCQS